MHSFSISSRILVGVKGVKNVSFCSKYRMLLSDRNVNSVCRKHVLRQYSSVVWPTSPKVYDWNRAVSDAEKIVGYPTSYFSLRCLLSDEFSNIALHLRRLVGTNHPILKTAKRLVYNGRTNMQTRGLIVLLISKAVGHSSNCSDLEVDRTTGISQRQRSLAEITEMIHTAHLVHKGILNLSTSAIPDKETLLDLQFGNKISVLSGDYLLANACKGLADLRNCKVVDLISKAIGDFMQAEFLGDHDKCGNSLPTQEMNVNSWEERNFLWTGSLMANSCKATLELAGQDDTMQAKGFEFGKNIGLAWQVHSDLQPFVDHLRHPAGAPFDFTCLPMIFHLESHPEMVEKIRNDVEDSIGAFDFKSLHEAITEGEAVEKAKILLEQYCQKAEDILSEFGESDAAKALSNIISALKV